jgi:hypothetical protein
MILNIKNDARNIMYSIVHPIGIILGIKDITSITSV